ncbi:MAG: phosphatidate cytidylyltransferase [Candidatus Bathyarchaeota archaeon]|nr:phosphatidate cytidylyltransferase [Candidatus Bathyarchaeota archaeon]
MLDEKFVMDIILLVACYAYVLASIVVSGKAFKYFGFSGKYSRKFLHVVIGNLLFIIPFFTLNTFPLNFPLYVAAPFILVTFLATPYSPSRTLRKRLKGLTGITEDGHHLGLVYYAFSYTLLALFFASKPYVIAAGVLPMAYGDASAAIIGKKYGKRQYYVFTNKSLEGSATMFLVSFLTIEVSLLFFSTLYSLPLLFLTVATLVVASIATIAEALSPLGFDNITVPMLGASVFLLFTGGI